MVRIYIEKVNFVIRSTSGTADEIAQILDVYRQCEDFLSLGPVPRASLEMVQADLAHSRAGGGFFCGIFDPAGGQMYGIVDFVASGFEGDPCTAFLSLLMIAAPYRGLGLGAAVVQAVEEWITADGRARAVRSGVQVNNPGAIRFWQRMGYAIVSGAEDLPDGTTAYQLYKPIQT